MKYIAVGNLCVAIITFIAGVQLSLDHHPILGFLALAAGVIGAYGSFGEDNDDLPPPQHPLVGA